MALDNPGDITKLGPEGVPQMRSVIDSISKQAVGLIHVKTEPTASQVPLGKCVVYDSGVARRVYFRTGLNGVGYVTLTMI